jgi:hypothetical protein
MLIPADGRFTAHNRHLRQMQCVAFFGDTLITPARPHTLTRADQ